MTRHLQELDLSEVAGNVDAFYYVFCGMAVFIMQLGFAMLEAGTVRKKNTKNILVKNFMDACVAAIVWWFCGFAFAFGSDEDRNAFVGGGNGDGIFLAQGGNLGSYQMWFFQWAFAATAASIVSGAVAERVQMGAYFCYAVILCGLVYPVVVHIVWSSDGFLSMFYAKDDADDYNIGGETSSVGTIDFAGSGVVHMTGGVAALCGAYFAGARTGRFSSDDEGRVFVHPMSPQSSSMQALGTFILWFGWYAFNAGSTLGITHEGAGLIAARCCVTTTLCAASCSLTCMFIEYYRTSGKEYSLNATMNGVLAGLVSITAGCPVVEPWAAVVIGFIGGFVYVGWSRLMLKWQIDDVVDAVAVHGACGAWGVLAAALFASKRKMLETYDIEDNDESDMNGLFMGGNGKLLGMAFAEIAVIIAWVGTMMSIFFFVMSSTGMLRVSTEDEVDGLDCSHHGGIEITDIGVDVDKKEKPEGKEAVCIVA